MNLETRASFWGTKGRAMYADDPPFLVLPLVCGKEVLEIGPGEGRQRRLLEPVARSYVACDICHRPNTLVMKSGYATDLGHRYDLVFFWCVLHHVTVFERAEFAAFVMRHLKPGGFLWFNAPADGETPGDGIATTAHPEAEVLSMFGGCDLLSKSRDDIYLMRRRA